MSVYVNTLWLVQRLLRLVALESMRQRQCFRSRTQWTCSSELKQLHFSDVQDMRHFSLQVAVSLFQDVTDEIKSGLLMVELKITEMVLASA